MNPKQYEWLAIDRCDALRQEAAHSRLLARARWSEDEPRRSLVRLSSMKALVERLLPPRSRGHRTADDLVRGTAAR